MQCNDDNYIKLLKLKKEIAIEYVVKKHSKLVKSVVVSVLSKIDKKDIAKECVNDVFLSIWENANKFKGSNSDFEKWIYKISKFRAIDYYRNIVKNNEVIINDDIMIYGKSVLDEVLMNENKRMLKRLLNTLKPIDRKIFIMKYILGMKSKDIAEKINISQTAVDNRIFKGKKKMNKEAKILEWRGIR